LNIDQLMPYTWFSTYGIEILTLMPTGVEDPVLV